MKKISLLLIINILIVLGLLLSNLFLAGPAGAATPTRAPTVAPTVTVTPTPTPQPKRYSNVIRKQIRIPSEEFPLVLFQGEIPYCPAWNGLAPKVKQNPKLPYIHFAGRRGEIGNLCIYGLDATDSLFATLTRPDGSQIGPVQFSAAVNDLFSQPDSGVTISDLFQEEPLIDSSPGYAKASQAGFLTLLYLWLPPGLSTGKWQVEVSNAFGEEARSELRIDRFDPLPAIGFNKPHVGLYPKDISPFLRPSQSRECLAATPGNTYQGRAVNLPPKTKFDLGVFQPDSETGKLIGKMSFTTNLNGVGRFDYTVKPDLAPGVYYISLPLYSGSDSIWEMGATTCFVIS